MEPAPGLKSPQPTSQSASQLRVSVPLAMTALSWTAGTIVAHMVVHPLMSAVPASVEVWDPVVLMELPQAGVGTHILLSQDQLQGERMSQSCSFPTCGSSVVLRSSASPGMATMLTDDLEHVRGQMCSLYRTHMTPQSRLSSSSMTRPEQMLSAYGTQALTTGSTCLEDRTGHHRNSGRGCNLPQCTFFPLGWRLNLLLLRTFQLTGQFL